MRVRMQGFALGPRGSVKAPDGTVVEWGRIRTNVGFTSEASAATILR